MNKWREFHFHAIALIERWIKNKRFYDGGGREKDILSRAYLRLIKHVNSIYKVIPVLGFVTQLPLTASGLVLNISDTYCLRMDGGLCDQVSVVRSWIWFNGCSHPFHEDETLLSCPD